MLVHDVQWGEQRRPLRVVIADDSIPAGSASRAGLSEGAVER
jgi:hypothetical protein